MQRSAAAFTVAACALVGAAAAFSSPAAGSRCATSPSRPASSFSPYGKAAGVGPGPVYAVVLLTNRVVRTGSTVRDDGLLGFKVLWIIKPSYHGPFSIRGQRVDAKGVLRFASDSLNSAGEPRPVASIQAGAGKGSNAGWRDYPSNVLVPAPGCYDLWIGGHSFVEHIRFSIRE